MSLIYSRHKHSRIGDGTIEAVRVMPRFTCLFISVLFFENFFHFQRSNCCFRSISDGRCELLPSFCFLAVIGHFVFNIIPGCHYAAINVWHLSNCYFQNNEFVLPEINKKTIKGHFIIGRLRVHVSAPLHGNKFHSLNSEKSLLKKVGTCKE